MGPRRLAYADVARVAVGAWTEGSSVSREWSEGLVLYVAGPLGGKGGLAEDRGLQVWVELLPEVLGALWDCLLTRKLVRVEGRDHERKGELSVHLLWVVRQETEGYQGSAVGWVQRQSVAGSC